MCLPVSVRHGVRGTSYLYRAWLYQLVHGEQMKMCFACFRAAFLLNKFYLEMGYWNEEELSEQEEEEEGEEVGYAEPMGHLSESESSESDSKEDAGSDQEAGSEQNRRPKRDAWQGVGSLYVPQSVSEYGGPGTLVPTPLWAEWVVFSISVPTELLPQEAVPLDLGPEDAEWTEALPWRLNALFPCSHRLIPPLSWWDIFDVMPSPGQPVLLELRSLWPLDQSVAQTWLQDQKFVLLLDSIHFMCHLLSLHVRWAVRTQVQHWQVLLNPGEMWVAHLKKVLFRPRGVYPWSLNILKRSDLGMELVPAAFYLRKKGFWLGSFLPWHNSIPETWSRDPGERLFITDATVCATHYHFAQTFFP